MQEAQCRGERRKKVDEASKGCWVEKRSTCGERERAEVPERVELGRAKSSREKKLEEQSVVAA